MKVKTRVEVSEVKVMLTIERLYVTEGREEEFLSDIRVKKAVINGKRVKGEDFGGRGRDIRFPIIDEGDLEMGVDIAEWSC